MVTDSVSAKVLFSASTYFSIDLNQIQPPWRRKQHIPLKNAKNPALGGVKTMWTKQADKTFWKHMLLAMFTRLKHWSLSWARSIRCTSLHPSYLTFWRRNYFLILAHPVYKMWIIQEPNTLDLWNCILKRKNGEYIPCLKYSVPVFVE